MRNNKEQNLGLLDFVNRYGCAEKIELKIVKKFTIYFFH